MLAARNPSSAHAVVAIRHLCRHGSLDSAFQMVRSLECRGLPIPRDIVYSLLQACKTRPDLDHVRKVRALMLKHGFHTISCFGDHIIRLFADCGSLREAYAAFRSILKPSIFTWNSLISAHSKLGEGRTVLELYGNIREEGVDPDRVTFVSLCNACGSIGSIVAGMIAHHHAIQHAFESDIVLGNSIIDMYAKCGCFADARKLFESTEKMDIVTWTVMISGYSSHGHGDCVLELFTRMQEKGIIPNKPLLLCALRACSCVESIYPGYLIHEEILEYGLETDVVIMSSVVDMYAKSGSLAEAQKVFSELRSSDVVSWAALIDGYAQNGQGHSALESYVNMLHDGLICPNEVVFLGVLKACGNLSAIAFGMLFHVQILERELESDASIGSALVDMYTKCKCIAEAYNVFIRLRDRNVVSWGAMITGLVQCDQELHAFEVLDEMMVNGIEPNRVIVLCILKACGAVEAHEKGMLIHDLVLQRVFSSDLAIANTLVHMYAKCGDLKAAQKVFDDVPNPDVVSFGALISGYSHQGYGVFALDLFGRMQSKGIRPERATFLSLLHTCARMGAARHGNLIHGQIIENGLDSGLLINNALVDMYAKTGRLDDAHKIYTQMSSQDVVSCSTMIEGFAQQGSNNVARELLEQMSDTGVKPDDVIFSSILTGCSNAGLVEEGHEIFMSMKESYGVVPTTMHYGSLIDLFSRAGKLYWAQDLLQTMPVFPDIITWTCLLGSCKNYRNTDLAKRCFSQLLEVAPVDSSSYILMVDLLAGCHEGTSDHDSVGQTNYLDSRRNVNLSCLEGVQA